MVKMEIKVTPTKDIRILGLDKRDLEKLAWCSVTSGVGRLFWIDGYLICLEVYDKAFEYEVESGFFPISQLCYTKLQNYTPVYDVGRGTQLPVTDVSDMKLYRAILDEIKKREK
jgi:hypothetical protein